jgi:hypothetical protein
MEVKIMLHTRLISKVDTFAGIYGIVNLKNNKFYIGSSSNLYKRTYYEHKRMLETQRHPNAYLQRAFNKDSKYFIYIIIENLENVNTDRLLEREQFWMDTLNACVDGYNLSPTANSSTTGFKMPKDAIDARIEKRQKAVVQFSLNGELIKQYENIKVAQDSLGMKGNHISNCCQGKRKTCDGFIWVYLDDYQKDDFNIINYLPVYKKPEITYHTKTVSQFDTNGNLIKKWNSGKEAAKELSLDYKGISGCASGRRKTYAKFVWKYDQ